MAHVPAERGTAAEVRNYPGGEAAGLRNFRFLRFSHIFASVMREILEAQFLEEVIPHSLSLTQFHLLKTITLHGGRQMGDVAEFLGISAPAGTKVINKLERLGLIRRASAKGDRRVRVLAASPKGRKAVRNYERLVAQRLTPALSGLAAAEVECITGLLERLSLTLARLNRDGARSCVWCAGYWADDCPLGSLRGGCPIKKLCESNGPEGDSGNTRRGRRSGRRPHIDFQE